MDLQSKLVNNLAHNRTENVRMLAIRLLTKNELEPDYIDHQLEQALKKTTLPGPDRGLLFELVYGVIRMRRHLDVILRRYVQKRYDSLAVDLKNILRCGLYQLKFLDKIPAYAAIGEAVEQAKKLASPAQAKLVNGVLRNYQRNPYDFQLSTMPGLAEFAAFYSYPNWLVKRMAEELPKGKLAAFLMKNNEPASVYVKWIGEGDFKSVDEFMRDMPGFEHFYALQRKVRVQELPHWQEGGFIAQDPGASFAVELLKPAEGERIADFCAAPGGKTVSLAKQVGKGEIHAVEFSGKRIQKLTENLRRTKSENVQVHKCDARSFESDPFDAILIDAPCSGLGVLARRVDLRWKRNPEDFADLQKLQLEILENAARLVKTDGRIVYSTCSIDRSENEDIIEQFLAKNSAFVLENASTFIDKKYVTEAGFIRTWPHLHHIDGSFSARLKRVK